MTGGAFGSIIAQIFQLTAAERKTLLAAGAAGGMTATFGTPVAAVLAGRRAAAVRDEAAQPDPRGRRLRRGRRPTAAAARSRGRTSTTTSFMTSRRPCPGRPSPSSGLVGLFVGVFAMVLTLAVYTTEDLFHRLKKVHWMWWPAIGGVVIGVGGLLPAARPGHRHRRDRRAAARANYADGLVRRAAAAVAGQGRHLVHVAGVGHLRRRAGAVAHDRRRRRPSLVGSFPRRGRRTATTVCGRWPAWPP